jgi:cell division protein FtsB
MARNRKKQSNTIQLGALAPVVVLIAFIGFFALSFVFLKIQLHTTGRQIKGLEQELAGLKTQNDVLRAQVASLSSRNTLQRRLATGFIKMTPISSDRIVRWNGALPALAMEDIRQVSNKGMLK